MSEEHKHGVYFPSVKTKIILSSDQIQPFTKGSGYYALKLVQTTFNLNVETGNHFVNYLLHDCSVKRQQVERGVNSSDIPWNMCSCQGFP